VHEIEPTGQPLPAGFESLQPIRSKPVLFHLPERLVPAYYLELMTEAEAIAYVISAADGGVLFRNSLMADDAFTYRVWEDGTAAHLPLDGPQGSGPTPHPTGLNDSYAPPFVTPTLVTLQNGPLSTNDPWLAPGAIETAGNNVDAYADLNSPDGFSLGDFRASTTAPGTFDRAYDTGQTPDVSATQQMASVTQLFYTNNFLHDWFYDSGFDEASGNAQKLNYGRGGVEGDDLRAEAQDFGGTNNANMSTPADGGRPRMQMYVFHPFTRVRVNSPAGIAGDRTAGRAAFGPQAFSVTADVVLVNDGSGTVTDACQAIVNSVAGKIALIDRTASDCAFVTKVLNAQAAGAVGAIIADHGAGIVTMTGGGAITIPALMISQPDGSALKTALGSGAVNVTLMRSLARDGTIDNQIVAHEWGHYISNRLVGNASGLSNIQGRGMGEGWGDFHALMITIRPEDAFAPSGPNFTGVYAMGGYALHNSLFGTNAYYFGVRRYPYSTELAKNPLTFRHIQNGVPLPVGPPLAFGASGANNAQVHNTGEVWCTMLWECYASLLRATGRLTFDQARDRMRDYLVAGYKMTPGAPTFLEARDAILAAAYATDAADFADLCAAFARRGAGVGAVAPDRNSSTNIGVTESYVCGGELEFVSATLDDDVHSCDSDGYLDNGEIGTLTVTLKNAGTTSLSATSATLSSTNPSVVFLGSPSLTFPASPPFGTTTTSCQVSSSGAAGIQIQDIHIAFNDPGLAIAGPRNHDVSTLGNADDIPTTTETVESQTPTWTLQSAVGSDAWQRQEITPLSHRFYGPAPGAFSDQSLVSPPLVVGPGAFGFTFKHSYSFEFSGGTYWDGGVVEISDNGGGTWTDIGGSILPGYVGTLTTTSGNPIGGRPAFAGSSPAFPTYTIASATLGTTYAGKTVQIRFRVGTDAAISGPGWLVDDLEFTGLLNQPFFDVTTDPGPCSAVAVEPEDRPAELAFAIDGPHPAPGRVAFRLALPAPSRVRITIHDVSGRRVATVTDAELPAGRHTAAWSAERGFDAPPAGVYFARLIADGRRITRRLVVLPR
jgi:hypothetical protein